MNRRDIDFIFKLVIVGDSYVGKTTLLQKYAGNKEVGAQRHLVEKELLRNGRRVRLQIYDTMGLERFRSLTASYYRGAKGCLICFDKWKPQSFKNVQDFWMSDIESLIGKGTPKLLLGISRRRPEEIEHRGTAHDIHVTELEIMSISTKYSTPYMDVIMDSAEDVDEVFGAITDLIFLSLKGEKTDAHNNGSIELSQKTLEKTSHTCGC